MPKYALARDCFEAVLKGQDWNWALQEAKASSVAEQSRHAIDILKRGRLYLRQFEGAEFRKLSPASWPLREGVLLPVKFDARLALHGREIALHYHFWKKEMTEAQERLALRTLRDALWALPGCNGMELELVQAPWSHLYKSRRLRPISTERHAIASDDEVEYFKIGFLKAWEAYHDEHPKRRWNHNR